MVAYRTLAAVTEDDAYANLVLPRLLDFHHVTGRDAAFATELAYGTLRLRGTLDAIISAAARREVSAIEPAALDVLRLGAYQLLRTRVATHAAVDTSVSLAREVVGHRVSGFVNAVLRKISQKNASDWLDTLVTGDETTDLALEFAHPEWIVREFRKALNDEAEVVAALGADNDAPEVHLAARPGLISTRALADEAAGRRGHWSPYAVHLSGGAPKDLPAIRTGRAHVQDEGSQLMAVALTRAALIGSEDDRWLDLCAGPGGKASLLGAIAAEHGARVTAVEVSPHRAELVAKSTSGLPVTVVTADGREFESDELFDRVLVDAPCSGLGALRRRPEARWRRSESDVPALVELQRELLSAALRLVRPGGVVAYVTCSPAVAETTEVVAAVDGNVERLDIREALPDMPDLGPGPSVQLWPHRHDTDAMFGALLRRPIAG